jgi:hypothetical protein
MISVDTYLVTNYIWNPLDCIKKDYILVLDRNAVKYYIDQGIFIWKVQVCPDANIENEVYSNFKGFVVKKWRVDKVILLKRWLRYEVAAVTNFNLHDDEIVVNDIIKYNRLDILDWHLENNKNNFINYCKYNEENITGLSNNLDTLNWFKGHEMILDIEGFMDVDLNVLKVNNLFSDWLSSAFPNKSHTNIETLLDNIFVDLEDNSLQTQILDYILNPELNLALEITDYHMDYILSSEVLVEWTFSKINMLVFTNPILTLVDIHKLFGSEIHDWAIVNMKSYMVNVMEKDYLMFNNIVDMVCKKGTVEMLKDIYKSNTKHNLTDFVITDKQVIYLIRRCYIDALDWLCKKRFKVDFKFKKTYFEQLLSSSTVTVLEWFYNNRYLVSFNLNYDDYKNIIKNADKYNISDAAVKWLEDYREKISG